MEKIKIKKQIDKKIRDYISNKINIEDLVIFIIENDPKDIYLLLEDPEYKETGHIMDMIQEYNFYKSNNEEQIVINEIKLYFEKFLKNK